MDVQLHKLSNGIPVIMIPLEGLKTFTHVCAVRGGSMYETKKTTGLSHMLEHVLFKGTKKRPTAKEIAVELDLIAGGYNAFTSFESIAFYTQSVKEHFEQITDVMSDQLVNSVLDSIEIEKEKGAVLEELHGVETDPHDKAVEVLQPLVYGDQAAGRNILGTEESVTGFTRRQIKDAMNRFFNSNNMFVIVAGDIPNKKETLEVLENHYKHVKSGSIPKKHGIKVLNQKEAQVLVTQKEIPQTAIALGVKAPSPKSDQELVVKVLASTLGAGMSSRLFHEVREERGLAYHVGATVLNKSDSGNMVILGGINAQKVPEALSVIRGELDKICEEGVSTDELNKVKSMLAMSTKMQVDSSPSVAIRAVKDMITLGRVRTYKEILDKLEKINTEDVVSLAQTMFTNTNLSLSVVGPHTEEDEEVFKDAITI